MPTFAPLPLPISCGTAKVAPLIIAYWPIGGDCSHG